MTLIFPPDRRAKLLANGELSAQGIKNDPFPVVKIFLPDAAATWLLTELDPTNPDMAFGLCDLGLGSPEIGSVSVSALSSLRGKLGLPAQQDVGFKAVRPLSQYAAEARRIGVIIA